jgi:hypothetical protein
MHTQSQTQLAYRFPQLLKSTQYIKKCILPPTDTLSKAANQGTFEMEILPDTASSGAHIASNHAITQLQRISHPIISRTLRSASEHLPTVDRQRLRTEKYMALSIIIPFK